MNVTDAAYDTEEASHVGVFAAEGLSHCTFGHVHGASVER